MTTKEFLQQYRYAQWRAEDAQRREEDVDEQICELMESLTRMVRPVDGDRVQGKGADRMADTVARMVDLDKGRNNTVNAQREVMRDVENAISSLDDVRYRKLLRCVYINGLRLNQAAEKLGYCYSWTRQLHGHALIALEKVRTQTNN